MKQQTTKQPVPKVVTKAEVLSFLGRFIALSVRYSGNENTFYINGADSKDAELALLKAFPGMPFKTDSSLTVPIRRGAKNYYFKSNGEFTHNKNASDIVFECIARDNRNARRKFGNYVTSLTAGTGTKAVA